MARRTSSFVAFTTTTALALALGACTEPAPDPDPHTHDAADDPAAQAAVGAGREARASQLAFLATYDVFMHPRCMNCHPAGERPLQGEDSHVHAQDGRRGPDGRGLFALRCANCHQHEDLPGPNMPPGHPDWRLPSAAMPLVFQGLTPRELAEQLKDPARNGGKTLEQVLHHVEEDSLVLTCWTPGEGRAKPPLEHAEFARRFREWVESGAVPPD